MSSLTQAQRVSGTGILSERRSCNIRYKNFHYYHAALARVSGVHGGGQPCCWPPGAGAAPPPGFSPAGVYDGDVPGAPAGLYCVEGAAGEYWYDADGACAAPELGGAPAGEYAAYPCGEYELDWPGWGWLGLYCAVCGLYDGDIGE